MYHGCVSDMRMAVYTFVRNEVGIISHANTPKIANLARPVSYLL
jgi:hypothetical protein